MTICPCCGFKSESTLSDSCKACGASPVGEPLPRPEHELPSYGRSLLLAVTGSLMVLTFLTETFVALTQRSSRGAKSSLAFFSMVPFDFWSWVAAAETAAWRLKWVMIPVSIVVLWGGGKLYRSIAQSPARFCGLRHARAGYLAAATVPFLILVLIGVTVPERLHHRQLGIEAGELARGHRIERALVEYGSTFGTLPSELKELSRLPDADGTLAAALLNLDASGYEARAEIAAKQKPQPLRGSVIRKASFNTLDETLNEGLPFTDYKLRLPGVDKVLGTEDDLIVNGFAVGKASEPAPGSVGKTATQARQP